MQVSVDRQRCQAHGQCEFVAPEVFAVNDDMVVEYDASPDERHRDAVEAAVLRCPTQAITLTDGAPV